MSSTSCNNETYFFKGTKLELLNDSISKNYKSFLEASRRKLLRIKNPSSSMRSSQTHKKHDSIKEKLGQDSFDSNYEDM